MRGIYPNGACLDGLENTHVHGVPRLTNIELGIVRVKDSAGIGSLEINRQLKIRLLLVYTHILQSQFSCHFSQVRTTMFPLNVSC
jgi:hypothetical protein